MEKTVTDLIRKRAEDKPDREAFVFVDKFGDRLALSRQDVWDRSRQFAAILKRQGIGKGDIVCNTLVNSPERIVTVFGTMAVGAASMHGQLLMADGEDLIRNLRNSKCKAIIVDVGLSNSAETFVERISYKDETSGEVRYKDLPHLTHVIKLDVCSDKKQDSSSRWLHSLGKEKEMFLEDIEMDDMAVIFNTSGTTGFSKLVPYSHGKLVAIAKKFDSIWNVGKDASFYCNRSLGWFGGYPHLYMSSGCKYIITNQVYGLPDETAPHMVNIIEEEKVTHANLAGIEIERILQHIDKPLSHLMEAVASGGGPIATFIEKANNVITKQIILHYGSTECPIVSFLHLDRNSTFENYCTGNIIKGVEMKILDTNGQDVPKGKTGEFYFRSAHTATYYLNDPEKSKETFLEDGWIKMGDVGYVNDKDQLFVFGRKSDAILKGSFIFNPGWLRAQILKCPGIQIISWVHGFARDDQNIIFSTNGDVGRSKLLTEWAKFWKICSKKLPSYMPHQIN